MRWLTSALLLAVLAAVVALILQINAGNVAFLVHPYRVDVSLNLFIVALMILLAVVYWVARAIQKVADFPEQVRLYRTRREEVGGQQALIEAVRSLLEGRFARAEKAARAAQSSDTTRRRGGADRRARCAPDAGVRAARRVAAPGRGRQGDADRAPRDQRGDVDASSARTTRRSTPSTVSTAPARATSMRRGSRSTPTCSPVAGTTR